MSEEIKLDEKELRLLIEDEAKKYGFGVEEIEKVLNICKNMDCYRTCIENEFAKLESFQIFKKAAESFKQKKIKSPKL